MPILIKLLDELHVVTRLLRRAGTKAVEGTPGVNTFLNTIVLISKLHGLKSFTSTFGVKKKLWVAAERSMTRRQKQHTTHSTHTTHNPARKNVDEYRTVHCSGIGQYRIASKTCNTDSTCIIDATFSPSALHSRAASLTARASSKQR